MQSNVDVRQFRAKTSKMKRLRVRLEIAFASESFKSYFAARGVGGRGLGEVMGMMVGNFQKNP